MEALRAKRSQSTHLQLPKKVSKLSQIIQELSEIPVVAGRWSRLQERLNTIQQAILALARGENLSSGNHIQIRQIAPHTVSITGTPGGLLSDPVHPWKPKDHDEGTILINVGSVSGNVIPENWNQPLPIDADTDAGMVWIEVDINEDGRATAARYINSSTVPDFTAPSNFDQLPPKLYYLLFGYASEDGIVSKFFISAKENLEVYVEHTGGVSTQYRWAILRERKEQFFNYF